MPRPPQGQPSSSAALLSEKVYEGDVGTDPISIEVIVARLRRKIGRALIETERVAATS